MRSEEFFSSQMVICVGNTVLQDFQRGSHMIKTNHVDDLVSATNEVGIILFVSRHLFVFGTTLLNEFLGSKRAP